MFEMQRWTTETCESDGFGLRRKGRLYRPESSRNQGIIENQMANEAWDSMFRQYPALGSS
jgi:hypothetical protein